MPRGKPDPIGYLTALERLRADTESLADLRAEECVVIEDAPRGIRAAKDAGMGCIGVGTSRPLADLDLADHAVAALQDIDLEVLRAVVRSS